MYVSLNYILERNRFYLSFLFSKSIICSFYCSPFFLLATSGNNVIIVRVNDAIENPLYEDNQTKEVNKWTHDPDFAKFQESNIPAKETTFWQQLIDTYLFPLEHDTKQQAKTKEELLELRYNNAILMYCCTVFVCLVWLVSFRTPKFLIFKNLMNWLT